MDGELQDTAMSTQVEDTELDGETEADHVVRWRLERLVQAGYGYGLAIDIALQTDVDLHQATDLVSRGCPPATAARILL